MIWWTGFPSHNIDDIWSRAEPLLKRGFESPDLLEPYYDKCKSGEAQVWAVFDEQELLAALLTEIVTVGSRKICRLFAAGGSRMKEWHHLMNIIELWAQSQDCTAIQQTNGRPGWARIFPDYKITRITLEKEL